MLHVFENTDKRPSHGTGEVEGYITASTTGLPVAADDGDHRMFDTLSAYGAAVPMPDGFDVTVYCSNGFLLSVLS